jgi:hypothetical protein
VSEYVLDHRLEGEAARLRLMSQLLDPMHRRRIASLGFGSGTRTLEIGCGNGSISAWLAERVAPGGRAVALDLDLSLVEERAPGLELRQGDILAGPSIPATSTWSPREQAFTMSRCRAGDRQPRRQRGAGWRDPADRAGLPAGQRRRAAAGEGVLGRLARLVAGAGDRLERRSHTRAAACSPGSRAGRGSCRDRHLQWRLAVGRVLEANDRRAAGAAARFRPSRRRPHRGVPFLLHGSDLVDADDRIHRRERSQALANKRFLLVGGIDGRHRARRGFVGMVSRIVPIGIRGIT